MLWRKWNDQLGIVLASMLLVLFAGQGVGWLNIPDTILGTLTGAFLLIVQFFFRRDPPSTPTP